MIRPSPSESAKLYKIGQTKKGNDGNLYKVILTANNKHRWVKQNSKKKRSVKKTSSKKKRVAKKSTKIRLTKRSAKRRSSRSAKKSTKRRSSKKRSAKKSTKRRSSKKRSAKINVKKSTKIRLTKRSAKRRSSRSAKKSAKRRSSRSAKKSTKRRSSKKRSAKKSTKRRSSKKRSAKINVKKSTKKSSNSNKSINIPKNKESLKDITRFEYKAINRHKHDEPIIDFEFKNDDKVIFAIYSNIEPIYEDDYALTRTIGIDFRGNSEYLNKFFGSLKRLKKGDDFNSKIQYLLSKLLSDDGKYMINLTSMEIHMDDEYNSIPIPESVKILELNHINCLVTVGLEEIMNVQHLIIDGEEMKGEKLLEIYNSIHNSNKRHNYK
jgi:hypothetical protein